MRTKEQLQFKAIVLPEEAQALVDFIFSDSWPFHAGHPAQMDTQKLIDTYAQASDDKAYFWILNETHEKLGLIKLIDLDDIPDGYPLFDLRILSAQRGQGIGEQAVRWLSKYLFTTYPKLDYIQAATREDNFAMRKVLLRCHFAKEGHLRKNWDGIHASILYGLLREDWESGSVTPVDWFDDQHLLP